MRFIFSPWPRRHFVFAARSPSLVLRRLKLLLFGHANLRAPQVNTGSTRLRETNGDRLFRRSGAVFAFPNVFHLFAHELAGLGGRRFAFALVFARAFNRFFFWHNKMVSPLATRLDVINNGRYA